MKSHGRRRQQRPGWTPCARRPKRHKLRKAARAPCSATHLGWRPSPAFVTARMADPGTMASPGVPLLQIDQAGVLQMQATVDQSEIGASTKG